MSIWKLKNVNQLYDWGSKTEIPRLLGYPEPHEQPVAEMWMGSHPKGTSHVNIDGAWKRLDTVICENPEKVLGADVSNAFSGQLPFLFKVLAAHRPLSIQAHPNAIHAMEGFQKENALAIPKDDYYRNYKDSRHKPELLYALTDFFMVCGFKPIQEIIDFFQASSSHQLSDELKSLNDAKNFDRLRPFFQSILTLSKERRIQLISSVIEYIQSLEHKSSAHEWVMRLSNEFPYDIGILSPFIMNYIKLEPGQAIFIPSGVIHGYFKGTGIELMANSDNVIRGGLTSKHIDVEELVKIVAFDQNASLIEPMLVSECERIYYVNSDEFALSVIDLKDGIPYENKNVQSCEILLCTSGYGTISTKHTSIPFSKGNSFFISAESKAYRVEGQALLYKAFIPER